MIRRRSFLGLLGAGAGMALLGPLMARLAHAGGRVIPRFVFFVEGNGYEPVNVLSASTRAAIDATLMAPIADARYWPRRYRHTSVLETVGDLDTATALIDLGALAPKTAVVLGLSSSITGGGHSAWHGALSSTRTAGGVASGPTIDAHLSQLSMLAGAPFDAVRLGYASHLHHPGKTLDYGTCALAAGVNAPLVLDPQSGFGMLFDVIADRPRFDRAGRVLDFARTDVNRALAAFPSSSHERVKLESYLAAVEQNIARRSALEAAAAALPSLPARPGERTNEDLYAVVRAQASNIAVALQGGLTHVAVLGVGTGADFDTFYDTTHRPRHDTHHQSETDAGARDYIFAQAQLQISAMIELARTLDAVPEGGGTLLDHTVLVYVGDNGETHHATGDEFPIVLMGGGAVGLRTGGRSLVYPGLDQLASGGHRQLSNLWNTLGHVAGDDLNAFGGESTRAGTRSAEGPLAELMG